MAHQDRNQRIHTAPGELNVRQEQNPDRPKPYESLRLRDELKWWNHDIGLVVNTIKEGELTYDEGDLPTEDEQRDILDALKQVQAELDKLVALETYYSGIVAGQRQYEGSPVVIGTNKSGAHTLSCKIRRGSISEITVGLTEETGESVYVALEYVINGRKSSISGQLDLTEDTILEDETEDLSARPLEDLI